MDLDPESWLVTADLSTARQKFQRAFAAEFLCPASSLVEFLDGDFSETAVALEIGPASARVNNPHEGSGDASAAAASA